jgi:hypothetical protein
MEEREMLRAVEEEQVAYTVMSLSRLALSGGLKLLVDSDGRFILDVDDQCESMGEGYADPGEKHWTLIEFLEYRS